MSSQYELLIGESTLRVSATIVQKLRNVEQTERVLWDISDDSYEIELHLGDGGGRPLPRLAEIVMSQRIL